MFGTPDRYRLTVRERDQEFFETYIQARGGLDKLRELNGTLTDIQRNFKDNALLFLSRLAPLPEVPRQRPMTTS